MAPVFLQPIPLPRGKIFNPEKTKDAEALKCSSPPQSPTTSSKVGAAVYSPHTL